MKTRNLWGAASRQPIPGKPAPISPDSGRQAPYKMISNQGHLSPSYGELLKVGLGGLLKRVRERKAGEGDAAELAFLTAAEESLPGVSEWVRRYAEFLEGDLARIAAKVATEPPSTFHEATQWIWFAHQAIHIEGHGWSCGPDHIGRLLLPYFEADKKAGRLNETRLSRRAGTSS